MGTDPTVDLLSTQMDDQNDVLARKLAKAGEYDSAIALKLLAGWSLTGEDCSVCVTQLICNRMKQTYCLACSQWVLKAGDPLPKPKDQGSNGSIILSGPITLVTPIDDTPSSIKVIKALPGRVNIVGGKPIESHVRGLNHREKDLEIEGRSPKRQAPTDSETQDSVRQGCGSGSNSISNFQKRMFCSVPPIVVDDDSGPIDAALWEEDTENERNLTVATGKNDSIRSQMEAECEAEEGSPRAVLEGPDSSAWSESSSRKSLLGGSSSGEDEVGLPAIAHPTQKTCRQSLWKSFSSKRWQSFPTSYKKKEISISGPVLVVPPGMTIEESALEGPLDQDCTGDLLSAAANAKRSWQTFSYEEISHATNDFAAENLVGKGGYAKVFKGVLKDGQLIAVKKHNRGDTAAEKERDFLIELGIISHVSHPNAATLLGICIENGLHLVFLFSPHGSLQPLLHSPPNSPVLPWTVRFKVAVGVARGLLYLHEECQRRIIHRDIKASNVLLGPDFEPQISDFGLAKWLPDRCTHHTVSPIEGTFGYLAPEYFMHGIVDEKTDVFSYGVLLLELITGRRPVDADKQNLVTWAKPYLDTENVRQLADRRMGGEFDAGQMQRMVLTAGLCVRQSAVWRPIMSQVLQILTEEPTDKGKAEHLSRLVSKSHDFQCSETQLQEDYGFTDDYESDMQRHRALALEFE